MENINNIYNVKSEKPKGVKVVSFSQFSMYKECPLKWKLNYLDNLRISKPGLQLIYGDAIHETIQEFLYKLFIDSAKSSNEMNLSDVFVDKLLSYYKKEFESNQKHFAKPQEIKEFISDGCNMLEWFKNHRGDYFNTRNQSLLGIETELLVPTVNPNVYFIAYLDLILEDTQNKKIHIYDLKTSNMGWKNEKKDEAKLSQLMLYKYFLALKFGIDPKNIDTTFFILKRKAWKPSEFIPLKYVQQFKPATGPRKMKKVIDEFNEFINNVFDKDGNYKKDLSYLAIAGDKEAHCKYCQFKYNEKLCPSEDRVHY